MNQRIAETSKSNSAQKDMKFKYKHYVSIQKTIIPDLKINKSNSEIKHDRKLTDINSPIVKLLSID